MIECSFGLLFIGLDEELLIAVFDPERKQFEESDWCVYNFFVERDWTIYPKEIMG